MTEVNDASEVVDLLTPRSEVILIESAEQVSTMLADLRRGTGALAVDAERASGFRYSQAAFLLQLHRRGSAIYLIDPQATFTDEESRFNVAAFMTEMPWILHASTQDLPCLNELGLRPTALIDTELGSRILGLPRVGLGAVVEHFLGFKLAKEHSAVDWSTRPLPADWLDYAALDVDVLPELAKALQAALEEAGKWVYAQQEFAHLTGFRPKEKQPDRWRGTTGAHEIKSQRGLAVVRELWNAREALAMKLDVSPGRLVPDASISAVAKILPRSKSELASERSFHGRASRTYLDTWWTALQTGLATHDLPPLKVTHTGIPNHRSWPNRYPDAEARLKAVKPIISSLVEELSIPAENLLTPDYLRSLCWHFNEWSEQQVDEHLASLGARSWQREKLVTALCEALHSAGAGERSLN
ncbi:MAG: hypothetical protein RL645_626 [Actinomycetota bacterium]